MKRIIYSRKTGRLLRGHPPMYSKRKACMHYVDFSIACMRNMSDGGINNRRNIRELYKYAEDVKTVVNDNALAIRGMLDMFQGHLDMHKMEIEQ
jgi:hypothetical protein